MKKKLMLILMLLFLSLVLLLVIHNLDVQKQNMVNSCDGDYTNKTCCQLDTVYSFGLKQEINGSLRVNLSELNLT